MVLVVEVDGSATQDNTPPTTPSWTQAEYDDSDRGPRLSRLYRRSRKGNDKAERKMDSVVAYAANSGHRPYHLDNRGLINDTAEPVNGIVNRLDPRESEESSDDEEQQKSRSPKPAPIQTQPLFITPSLELSSSPTSPSSPSSPSSLSSPSSPSSPTSLSSLSSLSSPTSPTSLTSSALKGSPTSPIIFPSMTLPPPPSPPPTPPPPPAVVSNPQNPRPTGTVVNPVPSFPGNTPSSMRFSTLTPSIAPTSRPTTTTNRPPPLSLTPIITLPVPALSSGARKGINIPPTPDPVVTFSTLMSPKSPDSPTSSSFLFPTPNYDSSQNDHNHDVDNIHPKVEMALVALGSVGSSIIVAFLGWLLWRCHKRRRGIDSSRTWKPHLPKNMSVYKPKLLVMSALARIPVLKDRIADRHRGWGNIDRADLGSSNEKAYVAQSLATGQPPLSGVAIQTDFVRGSIHTDRPQNGASFHVPKVSISSSIQPQASSTLRPEAQLQNCRLSDISSLSSGFGDGEFIMDTLYSSTNSANNTASETIVKAPSPVARRESVGALSQRRDTVYTEASEDMPARFRSVNSWVRQQSGRVTRAKQRNQASDAPPVPSLPPEQDFGLMMPDGEEPRRADSVMVQGEAR